MGIYVLLWLLPCMRSIAHNQAYGASSLANLAPRSSPLPLDIAHTARGTRRWHGKDPSSARRESVAGRGSGNLQIYSTTLIFLKWPTFSGGPTIDSLRLRCTERHRELNRFGVLLLHGELLLLSIHPAFRCKKRQS